MLLPRVCIFVVNLRILDLTKGYKFQTREKDENKKEVFHHVQEHAKIMQQEYCDDKKQEDFHEKKCPINLDGKELTSYSSDIDFSFVDHWKNKKKRSFERTSITSEKLQKINNGAEDNLLQP